MIKGLDKALAETGLAILGHVNPEPSDISGMSTLLLLGPAPNFWEVFCQSEMANDGRRDPVDRWSEMEISKLATQFDASAFFPFGGPPYMPFLSWALDTGRCWQSPVGMLVHDTSGLLISFRGALGFGDVIAPSMPQGPAPCETCVDKPCLSTCPVSALGNEGYDVALCKSYLSDQEGKDCMDRGCLVRRSCPISQGAFRQDAQSALHMRAFRGDE